MRKIAILVILDGWGIGREDGSNPVHVVQPKTFKWLGENFPVTSLQASGISVGLPWGEVGNSEVGHLTLGAGKVLYQHYPKITMAIKDKSFFDNAAFKSAFQHARKNNSAVNLVGLLSNGNIHASIEHLQALIKMAELEKVPDIKLHLFADGKDSPPKSIKEFLKQIPKEKLATLTGRYYAMDRNQNWQLTSSAYDNLTGAGGTIVADPSAAIEATFKKNMTEEYLPQLRMGENAAIKDNESVIFFNYREDSIKQLAESFIVRNFDKFPIKKFQNLFVATMTKYEDKFDVPVAFPSDVVINPMGKILSDAGKTQLRLAETYKYSHVTSFFNGYREPPFTNEYRVLLPSLSAIHPDEHPEMMAGAITSRLIEAIQNKSFDFVLVNYANADTIAHTSNFDAGMQAVRVINEEIEKVMKVAIQKDVLLVITSDHGNIEEMIDPMTGLPESQHDPNPVPLYLISPEYKNRKFLNWGNLRSETMGSLADVVPTIIEWMGMQKPTEMTGRSLLDGLV